MNDPFEIADLLVRCSAVPLPRIASVLGFAEPAQFSDWFEDRCGHHPESVRVTWASVGRDASVQTAQSVVSCVPTRNQVGRIRW